LAQIDHLLVTVMDLLEGAQEVEIVRRLLRFRDSLTQRSDTGQFSAPAEAARAELINIVNNFFYTRLVALPTIEEYLARFAS
jgi:hypothetical protein